MDTDEGQLMPMDRNVYLECLSDPCPRYITEKYGGTFHTNKWELYVIQIGGVCRFSQGILTVERHTFEKI